MDPEIRRRDSRSRQAKEYRRLYRTKRWLETRRAQLQVQPLCQTCLGQGRATAATVCNHADKSSKVTVKGFFAGPFTSECASCHDSVIQKQEKRGYIIGSDESGRPLDPSHPWNR